MSVPIRLFPSVCFTFLDGKVTVKKSGLEAIMQVLEVLMQVPEVKMQVLGSNNAGHWR